MSSVQEEKNGQKRSADEAGASQSEDSLAAAAASNVSRRVSTDNAKEQIMAKRHKTDSGSCIDSVAEFLQADHPPAVVSQAYVVKADEPSKLEPVAASAVVGGNAEGKHDDQPTKKDSKPSLDDLFAPDSDDEEDLGGREAAVSGTGQSEVKAEKKELSGSELLKQRCGIDSDSEDEIDGNQAPLTKGPASAPAKSYFLDHLVDSLREDEGVAEHSVVLLHRLLLFCPENPRALEDLLKTKFCENLVYSMKQSVSVRYLRKAMKLIEKMVSDFKDAA